MMPHPAPPSIVLHVEHLHLHLAAEVPAAPGPDENCINGRPDEQDERPRRGRPATDGKPVVNRILVNAEGPLGPAEVHRRLPADLDASVSAVKNWLAQLVTDGLACPISGGKYASLGQ